MQSQSQLDLVGDKLRHVTHKEKTAPNGITAKDHGDVPVQRVPWCSAADLDMHLILRHKQECRTDDKGDSVKEVHCESKIIENDTA